MQPTRSLMCVSNRIAVRNQKFARGANDRSWRAEVRNSIASCTCPWSCQPHMLAVAHLILTSTKTYSLYFFFHLMSHITPALLAQPKGYLNHGIARFDALVHATSHLVAIHHPQPRAACSARSVSPESLPRHTFYVGFVGCIDR